MKKETKNKNKFLHKIREHIFLLILIFLVVLIIIEKALNFYNIDFRNWFKIFILAMLLIFFIVGLIISSKNNKTLKKLMEKLLMVFIFLVILGAIFWRYTLLFGLVLMKIAGFATNEYVLDTTYGKKVVYVDSFLTDTSVEIHDYYNLFFCSYSYDYDAYSGSYDYVDKEKIESTLKFKNERNYDTNIEENQKQEIINEVTSEITESDEVLYKEKFGEIIISVVCKGDWSGKHIVQILKSKDNENSWTSELKNEEGVIDVHYGTEFIFFNENFGYYLDKGIQGSNRVNSELRYIQKGELGRVKLLISATEIGDKEYKIEELPYFENEEYKIKLKVYFENAEKEYILYSKDGKSFELR